MYYTVPPIFIIRQKKFEENTILLFSRRILCSLKGGTLFFLIFVLFFNFWFCLAAPWLGQLDACLHPLVSRVRISVSPYGFRGGRNGVWEVFWCFLPFFSTTHFIPPFLHTHLIHFICPCDGASGVVGRHSCRGSITPGYVSNAVWLIFLGHFCSATRKISIRKFSVY